MQTKKQRVQNDFYPTEAKLTKALLKRIPLISIADAILEPCSGDGAIDVVLEEDTLARVFCSDIAPFYTHWQGDATDPKHWEFITQDLKRTHQLPHFDWIITNPPYNVAAQILPLAWERAAIGMAMLLRLNYLEPCDNRGDWLAKNSQHLSDLIIFNPRPRFRSDTKKTDNCTVAWFVWRKDFHGHTHIQFAKDWQK